jgi:hypothetical protein
MLVAPNHLALPKPRWDEYFERQPEQFVAPVTVQLGASSIYLVNGPVTVEDEYRVRQVLEDLCVVVCRCHKIMSESGHGRTTCQLASARGDSN